MRNFRRHRFPLLHAGARFYPAQWSASVYRREFQAIRRNQAHRPKRKPRKPRPAPCKLFQNPRRRSRCWRRWRADLSRGRGEVCLEKTHADCAGPGHRRGKWLDVHRKSCGRHRRAARDTGRASRKTLRVPSRIQAAAGLCACRQCAPLRTQIHKCRAAPCLQRLHQSPDSSRHDRPLGFLCGDGYRRNARTR